MKPYYQDKWVTIYNGDCREVLPQLDVKVDLILTDPPFLTLFGTTENKNELGNYTILEGWWNDIMRVVNPVIKPAGNLITCCDWRTYPSFWRVALQNSIIPRNMVVWIHNAARHWHMFRFCHQLALIAQKPPTSPTDCPSGKLFDYWIEDNVRTLDRDHPVEKPIGFIKYLMLPATKPNDVVLDLFGGVGTTAMAAKELDRQCIILEIEEKYCEKAARRCCQEVMELV